jgi:hypothetical protein
MKTLAAAKALLSAASQALLSVRPASLAAAVSLLIVIPASASRESGQQTPAPGTEAVAGSPAAQPKAAGDAVQDPGDSPLVRAAKAARAARAAQPKANRPVKVITNADVKKSSGRLTVLPARPGTAQAAARGAESAAPGSPGMLATDDPADKERRTKKVEELKRSTAELETALTRLQEEYYQADDPTYRDKVIQRKFNDTKKELEQSRAELETAERGLVDRPHRAPSRP